jgi:hypothetical protein
MELPQCPHNEIKEPIIETLCLNPVSSTQRTREVGTLRPLQQRMWIQGGGDPDRALPDYYIHFSRGV